MKKISPKKIFSVSFVLLVGLFFLFREWKKYHEENNNPFLQAFNQNAAQQMNNSNIFSYNGKNYSVDDLPLDTQKDLFQEELSYIGRRNSILKSFMTRFYYSQKSNPGMPIDKTPHLFPYVDPIVPDEVVNKYFLTEKSKYPNTMSEFEIKSQIKYKIISDNVLRAYLEILKEIYQKDLLKIETSSPAINNSWLDLSPYPYLGSSSAKNTLILFASYTSMACRNLNQELVSVFKSSGTNAIKLVLIPFSSFNGPEEYSAKSAICVFKQDNNLFWKFHIALMQKIAATKIDYDSTNIKSYQIINDFIPGVLSMLNINRSQFQQCIDDKEHEFLKLSLKFKDSFSFLNIEQLPYYIFNNKKLDLEGRNLNMALQKEKMNE